MKFKKVITEAGAGHAVTADFWSGKSGRGIDYQKVRYNNVTMTLGKFISLSKKESGVRDVIEAIKLHPDYKGSVGGFILNNLKDKDGVIDIVLKKGATQFDADEIERNSGRKASPKDRNINKKFYNKFDEPISYIEHETNVFHSRRV